MTAFTYSIALVIASQVTYQLAVKAMPRQSHPVWRSDHCVWARHSWVHRALASCGETPCLRRLQASIELADNRRPGAGSTTLTLLRHEERERHDGKRETDPRRKRPPSLRVRPAA